MTWRRWLEGELAGIRARDQWRQLCAFDAAGLVGALGAERCPVVSFASNDYLGLSRHPAVIAAGCEAMARWGAGAGASRLVSGSRPVHEALEAALAEWKGVEAALVFPTGYAANLGVLGVLGAAGGTDVTIYSDQLNHASLVDGCRLSRARVVVYRHLDMEQLGDMLGGHHGRALVVSESVFSMDGDAAPVTPLMALCLRYGAVLVLDEAHAVLGPDVEQVPADLDLIRVGTLSKALGSLGGFVAAPRRWVELLVNRARPFIFTTAPTPADSAAALAALGILRSTDGAARRRRLRAHVDRLRPGHPSPIVPIILGTERDALDASRALLARGLLVPAIRPPTVPPGTARLRLALSSAHTDEQVGRLAAALADVGLGRAPGP